MPGQYIKEGYQVMGQWLKDWSEKNKAHICTGVSVAGTIGTGILAAKGGAKSARMIDKKEIELGRPLDWKEKTQLCWKNFIPSGISGAASISGSIGSDILHTKQEGKLTTLLLASEKAKELWKKNAKEVVGEKKAAEIEQEVAKDRIEGSSVLNMTMDDFANAPRVGSGELFPMVDEYFMLPFWSNRDYVMLQIKELQDDMRDLRARGDEFDYYDKKIGIDAFSWLSRIGYTKDRIRKAQMYKNIGWNKGFASDGSDDDPIGFQNWRPMEWGNSGRSVMVWIWEKDPTDMSLGRLIKSSGL